MPSLYGIDLVDTGLSGPIPDSWFAEGAWQALQSINLVNNSYLSGMPIMPVKLCMTAYNALLPS